MSASQEDKDFQAKGIEASDNDRTIMFKGKWITIYNPTTEDTSTDQSSSEVEKEFEIKAGYKCRLYGGGTGSFFKISGKSS